MGPRRWGWLATATLAGVAVLWLFDRVLDPVPVAAGPAFALGLLAWLRGRPHPLRLAAQLAATGAGAGVLWHLGWHATGASPDPAGGLFLHLAWEGLLGLAAAAAALGATGVIMRDSTVP